MKEFSNKVFEILKEKFTLVEKTETITSASKIGSVEFDYANTFSIIYYMKVKPRSGGVELLISRNDKGKNTTVFIGIIKDDFELLKSIIESV